MYNKNNVMGRVVFRLAFAIGDKVKHKILGDTFVVNSIKIDGRGVTYYGKNINGYNISGIESNIKLIEADYTESEEYLQAKYRRNFK